MHWSNVGLLVVAGFDVGVALLVWWINPRNRINKAFALNHFLLSGWALSIANFREASIMEPALAWATLQNVFSSTALIPFFFFALYFPHQRFLLRLWHKVFIFFSLVFIIVLAVVPGLWINGIDLKPPDNEFSVHFWGHLYFSIYFFAYVSFGSFSLARKYFINQGFAIPQISHILVGFGVLILFASSVGVVSSLVTLRSGLLWLVPYSVLPLNIAALRLILSNRH